MGKGTPLNKENKNRNYRTTGERKYTVNKNMRKYNIYFPSLLYSFEIIFDGGCKKILYYVIPNVYRGNTKTILLQTGEGKGM